MCVVLASNPDTLSGFAARQVRGAFSSGAMGMNSLNSFSTKRRKRRGSTSPPLINIHPNPGPQHQKKGRRTAKTRLDHNFGAKEMKEVQELVDQGVSTAEIARRMHVQQEVAVRWVQRYKQTGLMERKKPPGRPPRKRSRQDKENASPPHSQPRQIQKRPKLDNKEIGKIEMGTELGLSSRTLAKKLDRSQSTVTRSQKRLREKQPLERKTTPGSGRARKTTPRDNRHYKLAVARDRDVYAPEAAREVKDPDNQPTLSSRSVRRRLHEQGMKVKKRVKKPLLTEEQRLARLAWAKKHRRWTEERWKRVLWSDESNFTVVPSPMARKVWDHDLPGLSRRQIEPTKKFGGGHIMVWGCFSASGVGTLKRCTGTMNGDAYHNILVREVLPEMKIRTQTDKSEIVWLFQQDNASVHRAEQNKKYLKRKSQEKGFKVLDWPSQSPDLNPIENIWALLKAALRKRRVRPRSPDQVWAQVQAEWALLKDEVLQNLAKSMVKRCQQVISAHGWQTGY